MYTVEIQGLSETIAALGKYDATAQKELVNAMTESVKAIAWSARNKAPYYQGNLAGSMTSRVIGTGSYIIGEVYSDAQPAIYPLVMEYGRRAGAKPPPVAAIRPWVADVLGDESLAYVVARSIGIKGIKPHYFLRKAYRENAAAILGVFRLAVERIAQRLAVNP